MALLILALTPASDPATPALADLAWVLLDGDAPNATPTTGPLTLRPADLPRSTEVVLLVRAPALSWHRVVLPAGSARLGAAAWGRAAGSVRLRAILDGLLEDQLLDDPADVHLAVQQPLPTQGPVWVAACAAAGLQRAVQALAQQGWTVQRIVPEVDPDRLRAGAVVGGDEPQAWLAVRSGTGGPADASGDAAGPAPRPDAGEGTEAGVADGGADGADAVRVLPLQASTLAWARHQGAALGPVLAVEPAWVQRIEAACPQARVTVLPRAQRWAQAARGGWELAQFDLARSVGQRRQAALRAAWRQFWQAPAWRPARWALWALLLIQTLGLASVAWRERALLQTERDALRQVLLEVFPATPVVVDAPAQMARAVAQLRQSRGAMPGRDLASMLSLFSIQISTLAPAGYAVTALEFDSNGLRLTAPDLPAAQRQTLQQGLRAQGIAARWEAGQWRLQPQEAQP
ncbi:MAG: hypothetical protein Fur007_18240 [Rhodoferax sp.]